MVSTEAPVETAESSIESTTEKTLDRDLHLWTVKEVVPFLRVSERKVWEMLRTPDTEDGSIPHSRLGRMPRFVPELIKEWAAAGFPPAAVFKQWKETEAKRRKS